MSCKKTAIRKAAIASAIMKRQKYLALPPASGNLPESGGEILGHFSAPKRKAIEHAGHIYQVRLRQAYASSGAQDSSAPNGHSSPPSDSANGPRLTSASGNELQDKLATDGDDLYALLELGDKRWHATADEIKKSFRRISLLYHPDKLRHKVSHLGEEAIAKTETHFKKVMKAYDILSDKKKRAAYDSIDDVDDLVPDDNEVNDKNFFEIMRERFNINSRWSNSDRVPGLGDSKTPMEEVHKFYDFWYSFKTWRDFSFDLEYDTDQAECREEKRWMDRQNSKRIKSRKLEESQRIRQLTDLGYKKDPRIRKEKLDAKKKKEAQKEARRKQKEDEEAKKVQEAERIRVEQEEKAASDKERKAKAKKEKDAARKLMRNARKKLREVAKQLELSDVESVTAIEKMCSEGDVKTIEALANKLACCTNGSTADENGEEPGLDVANITEIVEEALANGIALPNGNTAEAPIETATGAKQPAMANGTWTKGGEMSERSEANGSCEGRANGKKMSGWTQEEMSLLSKGLGKFPGGTKGRWERLAHYIGTRSEEEVIAQVKSVRGNKKGPIGKSLPTTKATTSMATKDPPNSMKFSASQQTQLEGGMKKYGKEKNMEVKWTKIANEVDERTAKECEERVKELTNYYRSKKKSC